MPQADPPKQTPGSLRDRLRQFEDAWQSGTPRIEDHLPTDASRRSVLLELIKIDLEYRWRRPDPASRIPLENYKTRFPELGTGIPVDLIGAEYLVRHWVGDRPSPAEYLKRFAGQAEAVRKELARLEREIKEEGGPAPDAPSEEFTLRQTAVPVTSSDGFFEALRSTPLLRRDQLDALLREPWAGSAGSLEQLASVVVQRQWLTSFQVQRVLEGRAASLVVGAYTILEPVGRGMSGQVFRARHQGLDRIVALKLFSTKMVRDLDPKQIERFFVEMRAVGRLSHPHVVHAYDAGPVGGTHFLAMEYVDGVNLHRLVQQQGPLPLAQANDYVRQAALGLQHVLENGLVHRDIKPSNLIVGVPAGSGLPWGQVKILDLGLALLHASQRSRSSGALTQAGQVMGTADYMAPEQALNPHQVDIRTDLYSLGCTFYFLLAGHPPFAGGSLMQRMNRHLEEEAPPVASVRRDVPAELSNVIVRLMAKDPAGRFATPAELAAHLAALAPRLPRFAPGVPTRGALGAVSESSGFSSLSLAPQSLRDSVNRRRQTRWLLIGGAIGMVLFLIALSSVIAWAVRTGPRPDDRVSTPPTNPERKLRYVLDFDGESRFVTLPDNLLHDSNVLTIEVWFKTDRPGGIFGYQHTTYPDVPPHWVPVLYVGLDGNLYGAVWRGQVAPMGGTRHVNDGRWHHAALTTDGTSQSLFQDGERVDTAEGPVNHITMHYNQVGMACTTAWPQGKEGWSFFTGMIRDVRIWHIARTPEQVRQDMKGTLTGSERGLAAWYPMNESQGDRVRDQSSHHRDGRLGGGDKRFQPKRATMTEP
jgi:serine/threonine protein kinase